VVLNCVPEHHVSAIRRIRDSWYHWTYIIDYFTLIVIAIPLYFFNAYAKPYHRVIIPNDPALMYPTQSDLVPAAVAETLAIVTVVVFSFIYQFIRPSLHDLHHSILGSVYTFVVSTWLFEIFKFFAGKPRPNWSTYHLQNGSDSLEGFPSGHATLMFGGMTFATFYLIAKFRVFQRTGVWSGHPGLLCLCLLPMLGAGFVAVSRTRDYHHDFTDITAGTVIGTFTGAVFYFVYFPSLFDDNAHIAKTRKEKPCSSVMDKNSSRETSSNNLMPDILPEIPVNIL